MSTHVQLYVYECPPEQAGAVLDVLEDHDLGEDFTDADSAGPALVLGAPGYGRHLTAGDVSEEIARDVQERAPGALFITWTDPAEDYLGSGVMAGPDGAFPFESTSEGDAVFSAREILAAVASGTRLEEALGVPWTDRLDAARARLDALAEAERAIPAPRCEECTRRACRCEDDLEDEARAMNAAADRSGLLPA